MPCLALCSFLILLGVCIFPSKTDAGLDEAVAMQLGSSTINGNDDGFINAPG